MPELSAEVDHASLVIEIGGMGLRVNSVDPGFIRMLRDRYAGYVRPFAGEEFAFDVDLTSVSSSDSSADVRVTHRQGLWTLTRGDFRAEWEPAQRRRATGGL